MILRVRCGENTSWLTPSENVINRESTRFTKRRRFARGCRARISAPSHAACLLKSSTCTAPVFVPTASIRLSIARHAEKPRRRRLRGTRADLVAARSSRGSDDSDDSATIVGTRGPRSTSLQYVTPSPARRSRARDRVFTSVTGAPWSAMVPDERAAVDRRDVPPRTGGPRARDESQPIVPRNETGAQHAVRRAAGASFTRGRPRRATRPRRRPRRTSPAEASDETRGTVGRRRKEPFFAGGSWNVVATARMRRRARRIRGLARERSAGRRRPVAASSVLLPEQTSRRPGIAARLTRKGTRARFGERGARPR